MIKSILDQAVIRYNNTDFIENDPIQIPHRFSKKEDIEIAGFLSASIAWGQRKTIINNGWRLMERLDFSPYEFIMEESDFSPFSDFVHRTFNGLDCQFFLQSLKNIYQNHGGLEQVFTSGFLEDNTIFSALKQFRSVFFEIPYEDRTRKHIPDVSTNSSAKRLNMFLRWMVRKDENKVDFGLWEKIPMSALMLPLDVHTSNVARDMKLTSRKQNDWKAVEEITVELRKFDPDDPVKYDFALFGIGVNHASKSRLQQTDI
ncbi:MAG: TIGR02757 family protein [Porphyromonadaceae bacterium]|jgi:uncharacterized protein (TIGR02757 family)|nr:TIGR02757 family protein [Porphyromonadaceae bacterium]